MTPIDTIPAALMAIDDFRVTHAATLPDALRVKLYEAAGQAAPLAIRDALELLYANADELPEAKPLVNELATFMSDLMQLGYQNGRGAGIATAMMRKGGREEGDPEFEARFAPTPTMPDAPVEAEAVT